jgi:hypothetical protein
VTSALTEPLVINNCTRGIFVTTSRFQPGAVEAASKSSSRGFPIELVDAKRFYEILQIDGHSKGETDSFFAMSKEARVATQKSEVLQGTLDLMILKTLHALGPQHGNGIARRIEQLSEDVLTLNAAAADDTGSPVH